MRLIIDIIDQQKILCHRALCSLAPPRWLSYVEPEESPGNEDSSNVALAISRGVTVPYNLCDLPHANYNNSKCCLNNSLQQQQPKQQQQLKKCVQLVSLLLLPLLLRHKSSSEKTKQKLAKANAVFKLCDRACQPGISQVTAKTTTTTEILMTTPTTHKFICFH